jgi:hypothetical protein
MTDTHKKHHAHRVGMDHLGKGLRSLDRLMPADIRSSDIARAAQLAEHAQWIMNFAAGRAIDEQSLPRQRINGVWYYRDEQRQEYRRVDNPKDVIRFATVSEKPRRANR